MDRVESVREADTQPTQQLDIEVVFCPRPGVTDLVRVRVPADGSVLDAVLASGLPDRHGLATGDLRLGVWGKPREPQSPLRERDRVEIYRPLTVDPKEARRLRYRKQRQAKTPAAAGSTAI